MGSVQIRLPSCLHCLLVVRVRSAVPLVVAGVETTSNTAYIGRGRPKQVSQRMQPVMDPSRTSAAGRRRVMSRPRLTLMRKPLKELKRHRNGGAATAAMGVPNATGSGFRCMLIDCLDGEDE